MREEQYEKNENWEKRGRYEWERGDNLNMDGKLLYTGKKIRSKRGNEYSCYHKNDSTSGSDPGLGWNQESRENREERGGKTGVCTRQL